MIRVLVVDDSATVRVLLTAILEADPGIRVIGSAASGEEAVRLAQSLQPDLITMDVYMPGIDGFEATRRIMATRPAPIIVISAAMATAEVHTTFNALQAGALNVMTKPPAPDHPGFARYKENLLAMVRRMAVIPVSRERRPSLQPTPTPTPQAPITQQKRGLVAIGASTGGPAALSKVLRGLPATFPTPVLMVQHMTPGFTAGLVSWLQNSCALPIKMAEDREEVKRGTVYVAPDDRHLVLQSRRLLSLSDGARAHSVRPAVSVLFESAASVCGPETVGVLLTGMGKDGAAGLKQIREAGGVALVQDEASSVVWGMPGAAVALGAYDLVLPLERMAAEICRLVRAE